MTDPSPREQTLPAHAIPAQPVLQVRDLHKTYNGNAVLKGVEFDIARGQVKAVLGPSGSGKSTMLRLMALLETADAGEILLNGTRIGGRTHRGHSVHLPERQLAMQRQDIGMVFQRFNLFPHLTAVRNVMLGLTSVKGISHHDARSQAMDMLAKVGLGNRADHFPSELSGGQQQRVAIARALVLNPSVMLFDEPTSALDPELVGEVLEVMERLAETGMTMIVVTHEVRFARRVANEVTLFDGGVIVEQAEPEQFFTNPQHERTRKFLSHVH
ncbi:amino acid ABC transporter ATP-binding protein [Specibacter cremeus]|uniref:amino acid ABC transporter ATP-binding protein n=1 Tax=Specibacter cremeus TaxID=1629051 RepID=UPI0023E7DF67|nr:amino acid ABC transporter ATP-binding protein [Specibacter cremeus]